MESGRDITVCCSIHESSLLQYQDLYYQEIDNECYWPELFRLLCQTPEYEPKEIVGIDNNESALFFMDQTYLNDQRTRLSLADVRDYR